MDAFSHPIIVQIAGQTVEGYSQTPNYIITRVRNVGLAKDGKWYTFITEIHTDKETGAGMTSLPYGFAEITPPAATEGGATRPTDDRSA